MTDAPQPISANPGDAITALFKTAKAVIGVVHLAPLPGAPRYDGEGVDAIYDRALADARAYLDGGCDAVMVENHGDIPFAKPDAIGPEVPAHMAVIADRIHTRFGKPVGVNVLANAPIPALAVASAASAGFIRVNQWANAYVANEGLLDGDAAAAMRYRAQLRAKGIRIFADAHVKHGAHAITGDRAVEELVRDLVFFDVDAIIATGHRPADWPPGRPRLHPTNQGGIGPADACGERRERGQRRGHPCDCRRGHRRIFPQAGRGLVESG